MTVISYDIIKCMLLLTKYKAKAKANIPNIPNITKTSNKIDNRLKLNAIH